jgi:hypothetical protein
VWAVGSYAAPLGGGTGQEARQSFERETGQSAQRSRWRSTNGPALSRAVLAGTQQRVRASVACEEASLPMYRQKEHHRRAVEQTWRP